MAVLDLAARLRRTHAAHGGRPAILHGDAAISYDELFDRAGTLAAFFRARLPQAAPVGIFCQGNPTSLIAILAAVLAGCPYVPLNPKFPADRLRSIVEAAGLAAVACDGQTAKRVAEFADAMQAPRLVVAQDAADALGFTCDGASLPRGAPPETVSAPDATAYMMFTSGTTGTPKGVRVLNRNLCAYLDGIRDLTSLTPEDRCSHFFDLSFDLSVHDIFVTWEAGAALALIPPSQTMDIVGFVNSARLTTWFSVPSTAAFAARLGQLTPGAMPTLRLGIFCGEPLPVKLAQDWLVAAPNAACWNIYGPTEATIAFTAYEVKRDTDFGGLTTVPLGRPLPGQQVRFEPVKDGEPGATELLLGGSQVTPGYINNPEQLASKFFDEDGVRWYRTGDVAEDSTAHGVLFLGRVDDQVKINGYRVELMEIEAVLRDASGSAQVAAIAWASKPDAQADQIIAFICGATADDAAVKAHCRDKLPAYMVPRKFVAIDAMPVTTSGKVDRKALRAKL